MFSRIQHYTLDLVHKQLTEPEISITKGYPLCVLLISMCMHQQLFIIICGNAGASYMVEIFVNAVGQVLICSDIQDFRTAHQ